MGGLDGPIFNPTPGLTPDEDRIGHRACRALYHARARLSARGYAHLAKSRAVLTEVCRRHFDRRVLELAFRVRFCGLAHFEARWSDDEITRRIVEDICESDPNPTKAGVRAS